MPWTATRTTPPATPNAGTQNHAPDTRVWFAVAGPDVPPNLTLAGLTRSGAWIDCQSRPVDNPTHLANLAAATLDDISRSTMRT